MRKIMLAAVVLALSGCAQESKVESQEKLSTPGGTTTRTITEKVDKTGDHKNP